MTVQEVLDLYTGEANYVTNSLIVKSYDDNGCTYKLLLKDGSGIGMRKEIFIATSTTETPITDRTVIEYVDIGEAR